MIRFSKGFSLVEALAALVITTVIVGGVLATFGEVNKQTRAAAALNSVTYSNRAIYTSLSNDLHRAGQGIADINSLEIHFNRDGTNQVMYPIENLTRSGLGNFSDITINYFDYDFTQADDYPTLIASFTGGDPWDGNLVLMSNVDTALNRVQAGDIFLVYAYQTLYNMDYYSSDTSEAIWNIPGIKNQAVIVQVEPGGVQTDATNGHIQFYLECNLLAAGTFSDAATAEWPADMFEDVPPTPDQLRAKTLSGAHHFKGMPFVSGDFKTLMFARKLGDADSYHNVRYFVQNNELIRQRGGEAPRVLARNVTEFSIEIGLDTANPDPNLVTRDELDGYVSYAGQSTEDRWIQSISDEATRTLAGRHGVSLVARFGTETELGDPQEQIKRPMNFVMQIRLGVDLPKPSPSYFAEN